MTVAMYGETATGPTGENRDLVGGASTSFPPKMETPSARSGDQPEKNEWEPDASDALDRGEAMEANAFARDAANEHPDDRSASAGRAEGGRAQEGGESPISALTTCRAGGSADPATRDASEENEGRIHVHDDRASHGRSESAPAAAAATDARQIADEKDEDARVRAACASCFSSADDEGRMSELRAMGQKELQETFRVAFRRATTSNNNQWLRRRIAGALGLEAAPAPAARAAGGSARGTPGASPGSGLTTPGSAGGTTTEDGVRKSNRAAKPKILDFLPSAVCAQVANELPGEAAVNRRVRVFWPAEGAFFPGTVQAFNAKNGKHAVRYDDGDVEEVLLAAERIEWVYPGEDATVPRAPATAAGGGALSAKTKAVVVTARRINFAVPQPGKPADVLAELPSAWPSAGQHVWGRVKGHGWWPGVVIGGAAAEALGVASNKEDAAMRSVRFFDNTAAAVHRHDLVPFREYEKTLGRAKKNASFLTALKAAKQSFEKAAKRGEETALPARLTKQQQAAAAKAAAAAEDAPPSASGFAPPFEDPAKASKRKSIDVNDEGGVSAGSFPRLTKMLFDPAGVPLKAEPGVAGAKKKARFAGDVSVSALGDLERRVGFTRDGDSDFVRAAEAKIAAEAFIASAPSRGGGFQKPQAPKRSHKKGQGLKARAAAEAAGLPWPPPRPPGVGRGRGRGPGAAHRNDGSGKPRADATQRAHIVHMPMSANPGDQLGLLSRKLDALQTRVAPLAIAASQHLRKQLQLSQLAAARGGNPQMHPSAMMTEDERATLLEEMEVLQRLLHWSDGDARRERGEQHGYGGGGGGGARFFDGGSYVGEGAGMPAPRGAPDPGMVRLDNRWADTIHDPIDMAMLRGGDGDVMHDRNLNGDGNLNGNLDGNLNELWGAPGDGDGDGDDGEYVTDDFLRSAGPSIEVDTLMAEVHGARRAAQTAAAQTAATEPTASKPAECMASAPGARARTASPAPSDTTQ